MPRGALFWVHGLCKCYPWPIRHCACVTIETFQQNKKMWFSMWMEKTVKQGFLQGPKHSCKSPWLLLTRPEEARAANCLNWTFSDYLVMVTSLLFSALVKALTHSPENSCALVHFMHYAPRTLKQPDKPFWRRQFVPQCIHLSLRTGSLCLSFHDFLLVCYSGKWTQRQFVIRESQFHAFKFI